jgi:predicted amidohydrolase
MMNAGSITPEDIADFQRMITAASFSSRDAVKALLDLSRTLRESGLASVLSLRELADREITDTSRPLDL